MEARDRDRESKRGERYRAREERESETEEGKRDTQRDTDADSKRVSRALLSQPCWKLSSDRQLVTSVKPELPRAQQREADAMRLYCFLGKRRKLFATAFLILIVKMSLIA